MLKGGILNPAIQRLLAQVRHTNRLVIADRGFPFWPEIETIDLTLVDDIPTVAQVLTAVLPAFQVGPCWMASEFSLHSDVAETRPLLGTLEQNGISVRFEPHLELKKRVPGSIGLIRTADTLPYSNVIVESA